jgi:hypothetical protein
MKGEDELKDIVLVSHVTMLSQQSDKSQIKMDPEETL